MYRWADLEVRGVKIRREVLNNIINNDTSNSYTNTCKTSEQQQAIKKLNT